MRPEELNELLCLEKVLARFCEHADIVISRYQVQFCLFNEAGGFAKYILMTFAVSSGSSSFPSVCLCLHLSPLFLCLPFLLPRLRFEPSGSSRLLPGQCINQYSCIGLVFWPVLLSKYCVLSLNLSLSLSLLVLVLVLVMAMVVVVPLRFFHLLFFFVLHIS